LIIPSVDAIDYTSSEKKNFFKESYLSTSFSDKACEENCYYFVGEKGTGKTALAFHIQNNEPNDINAKLLPISEAQYTRFINLKTSGKLAYTDYPIIWRATILYLICKLIIEKRKRWYHSLTKKFNKLQSAITTYDKDAHIPELEYVIEFATSLTEGGKISANLPEAFKLALESSETNSVKTTQTSIKASLLECEKVLKNSLYDLKLNKQVVLFLDGIDAKPGGIEFIEYQKCIAGLAEAAWSLNKDFFSNFKHSSKKPRVVLLLRPDVFDSLNLHNSNCKLTDNSVIFDWGSSRLGYKHSDLYKMSDKYFNSQNDGKFGWEDYFQDTSLPNRNKSYRKLLRISYQRPRDIFSAIKILIGLYKKNGRKGSELFTGQDIHSPEFTKLYSQYLLGEVKNYSNYYISNSQFDILISFFQHFDGKSNFTEEEFEEAYNKFSIKLGDEIKGAPNITTDYASFLQFWYDVNVIGYKERIAEENNNFYHWSYRERNAMNVMPKIKKGCIYIIHPGIAKALDIGKPTIRE
ncbi:P-loop ATPase, Sll1717 family, partial [Serratia sp. OLJL1]